MKTASRIFHVCSLLFETSPPSHPNSSDSCSGLVDQELLVLVRPEETAEGVFLHQGVDPLLGQVKGCGGDIHQVSEGHILGEVVNVHLWRDGDKK